MPEEIAQVLLELWDRPGTLIVVSSDLSHYQDYETARRLDAATAVAIEHGDWPVWAPIGGSRALAGLLLETGRRWPEDPATLVVQLRRHGRLPRPGRGIRSLDVRADGGVNCQHFHVRFTPESGHVRCN